jgi:hypothetical protein
MKFALLAALLVLALPAKVLATPVPAGGVTIEQMARLMIQHGWPAKVTKDSDGDDIISSRVGNVNFDVYFYECANGRCRDIQFAAGWSNSGATPDKINEWNTTKRFLRVYWKPGNVVWAEQDVRVARGTTENIDEQLTLWPQMLATFKTFMHFPG